MFISLRSKNEAKSLRSVYFVCKLVVTSSTTALHIINYYYCYYWNRKGLFWKKYISQDQK